MTILSFFFILDLDEGAARVRVVGELDDLLQIDAPLLKGLPRPPRDELGRELQHAAGHRHRRLRRRLATLEHPDLQVRHDSSPSPGSCRPTAVSDGRRVLDRHRRWLSRPNDAIAQAWPRYGPATPL